MRCRISSSCRPACWRRCSTTPAIRAVFGLFAGLMLVFVLSFNSIGTQRDPRAGGARTAHAPVRSRRSRCRARAASTSSPSASWPRRARCSASTSCISCSSIASGACWISACTSATRFGMPARTEAHRRRPVRLADRARRAAAGRRLATRAAGVGAASRGRQRSNRLVARRAARQRRHRAGTAERAAHAGRHLRPRRSAPDAAAGRAGRGRARGRARVRGPGELSPASRGARRGAHRRAREGERREGTPDRDAARAQPEARARVAGGCADRRRQPPLLHAAALGRDRSGARGRPAAQHRDRRSRSLQDRERRARSPGGRPGAAAERGVDASQLSATATWWRASAAKSSR